MKTSPKFQWLRDRADYDSDDCLVWPFSKNNGYGNFGFQGRQYYAHRIMCEMQHGPAPEDQPEVRHLCGRRECVNPRHLAWGSRSANQLDRRTQRTDRWRCKIEKHEYAQIRVLGDYLEAPEIAEMFGVTASTIRNIQAGHWGNHPQSARLVS